MLTILVAAWILSIALTTIGTGWGLPMGVDARW